MNISQGFSAVSMTRLESRNLSTTDIQGFAQILSEAENRQTSAKAFLASLSPQQLALLQKSNGLVEPIQVTNLSEEGAQNLLSQPDGSDRVDLNNDGIVEVGIAKTIQFPPVNAPQHVKQAWENATKDLSWGDKAILELSMHFAVYGVNIEGLPSKTPLSPAQQWSQAGIADLFNDLYGNLAFRVGMEGWTEHNRMLQSVYQDFAEGLGQSSAGVANQLPQTSAANSAASDATQSSDSHDPQDPFNQLNQLIIDARIGLDRRQLEEIEKKIEAVQNDDSLSPREKRNKLLALEEQRQLIIEEAQRRAVEQEKRKSSLNLSQQMSETLLEMGLRQPQAQDPKRAL
ncbi:hypothetical protein LJ739_18985 [Aestuariibacter halophilus]|uniref:Uncharacterized protein n=1 Tax=Fluctibacter halophilus TaxID=226011 RepID=A0ABS8GGP7_9ALTE|nr:hypothetical protein [Aestuariibacter halophilus]MCC2618346.1 hypothetical protein [Aestuariibacter halophilus]